MKTITKTRLRRAALAVLALLLFPLSSTGQELIRECNVKGDPSLIRARTNNVWMIYYEDDVWGACFANVTSSGTTADFISVSPLIAHVYDFEILDDIVYFCGTSANNTAVMGYFSLTNFPMTPVYTCTIPLMSSCRKLEVGYLNGTRHVVMTGDAILGTSHIVDARDMGSNQWNFIISYFNDKINIYDDVAITDNYVVISARDTSKNGYFYRFDYPANNTSLLPQLGKIYIRFNLNFSGEILLDRCLGDTLAYSAMIGSGNFVIGLYNVHAYNTYNQYRASTSGNYLLTQFKYNSSVRQANTLIYNSTSGSTEIYKIGQTAGPGGNLIIPTGHKYDGESLLSLDTKSVGWFIASGWGDNGYLRIYRYTNTAWQQCATQSFIASNGIKLPTENKSFSLSGVYYVLTAQSSYCVADEITVSTECP